jgi:hypothetical protein
MLMNQKIGGRPDRSCRETPVVAGWDSNENKDHNTGSSVRTVVAMRVDPLPDGTTDFNRYEGGWNLADKGKLIIYGAINPLAYSLSGKVVDGGNGKGIPDVKIAFSLLSIGSVAKTVTSPSGGHPKNRFESGKFRVDLPEGESTVVPSKESRTFTPASMSISSPDSICDLNPRHSDNKIEIIGFCSE